VKKCQTWLNEKDKRTYRVVKGVKENQRVLVLWRDMARLDPKLEREFLEAQLSRAGEFEEKWINGDSATPGIASLDAIFKRLIEEEDR
jgi:hypothetical protein